MDEDARGNPHETEPPPYLPSLARGSMLPGIHERRIDLSRVTLLDSYPSLTIDQAGALVKSARSYQEAICVADGNARLARLRLVTAVEALAQLPSDTPAALRLRDADPELAELVLDVGSRRLTELVTEKFVQQAGVTRKFVDFLSDVGPPPRRPNDGRTDWRKLRKQLSFIYNHRSKDLHEGVPFPRLLCEAPSVSRAGLAEEASRQREHGGIFLMRLHVFEYVVRAALLNWWAAISTSETGSADSPG